MGNKMKKSTLDKYLAFASPLTGYGHDFYFNGYIAGLNAYYARLKQLKTLDKHEAELERARMVYPTVESADGISDGLDGRPPSGYVQEQSHLAGNDHAVKDAEPRDNRVIIRCSTTNKTRWDAHKKPSESRADFITRVLNAYCDNQ
jgi:hypothetical protein